MYGPPVVRFQKQDAYRPEGSPKEDSSDDDPAPRQPHRPPSHQEPYGQFPGDMYGRCQPDPYQQAYPPPGYPAQVPPQGPQYAYGPPPQAYGPPPPQAYGPPPPQAYGPPPQTAVYMDDDVAKVEPGMGRGGMHFTTNSIRHKFIRKVFGILFVQLLVVTGLIAIFVTNKPAKTFIRNEGSWLYWISYFTFLVTYLALVCCEGLRRKHPINLVMTAVLTLALGFMAAMISAYYDTEVVLMALITCAAVCGSIIIFSMQTKYDFTQWIGVMFVVFIVVFIFGIVAIVALVFFRIEWMYVLYAGLMALVFMVFLAIDVQMVMGGKKYEISEEDYVYAAIQLFVDIVYIFLMLLQLIGYADRR